MFQIFLSFSANIDIFSGSVFMGDAMNDRKNLLRCCLDGKPDRELQALFALQQLMHQMQHPTSKSDITLPIFISVIC